MMTGSSMLANHLHKSILSGGKVSRGWDWRKAWSANTTGEAVLRKMRLGLAKDLAVLWLEDADGVALY
jgi:homoaconitase